MRLITGVLSIIKKEKKTKNLIRVSLSKQHQRQKKNQRLRLRLRRIRKKLQETRRMQRKIKFPTCKKNLEGQSLLLEKGFFPFCSEKCKMRDLYGWFTEESSVSRDLEPRVLEDR